MEQFKLAFDNFINSPVGSIVVGVLGTLIIFLVVFSKTSLGKKLFNRSLSEIAKINEIARLSNEKVENIQNLAEIKINELASEYEQKSAIIISYYNELEKGIYEILEKLPNAKVQNALKDFKEKFNEKKEEIAKDFPTYDDFLKLVDKAREVEIQVDEKVREIELTYQAKLLELQEQYENRFKELEDKFNEREEETIA